MNSSNIQDRNERLRKSKDNELMYDRSSMIQSNSSDNITIRQHVNKSISTITSTTNDNIASSEDNYFDHIYEFDSNKKSVQVPIRNLSAVITHTVDERNSTYTSFSDMNTSEI